ncbi:MAG TPA: TIGR02281 family clan AA aspartic protease [Rhodobacteraceae bacterium]|nr:TIGR02281 family clan AA aspartic protease [Paracoccaceae bacterium]
MTSWEIGNLAYLVLLGAVLAFWFFVSNRQSLGRTVKQAAAWGFIFLGTIAVIGLWDDIRSTVRPMQSINTETGQITLPRAPDGHYYATLQVNGAPVRFLVDTGASEIVLTAEDATRAGLDLDTLAYTGRAMTANGMVRTAPVTLDEIALGPVTDRDLRAFVNEGEMDHSLLGMTYLRRWERIEITNDGLILSR